MLRALCPTTLLLFAGHCSTHTPHPVQSSGATWMLSRLGVASSLAAKGLDAKVSGAPSRLSGGSTLIPIALCGHTIAHLPQSMQMSGSQIGISWASARFSYRVVPVGKVPSTGNALTGSRCPSPARMRAVTPVSYTHLRAHETDSYLV